MRWVAWYVLSKGEYLWLKHVRAPAVQALSASVQMDDGKGDAPLDLMK